MLPYCMDYNYAVWFQEKVCFLYLLYISFCLSLFIKWVPVLKYSLVGAVFISGYRYPSYKKPERRLARWYFYIFLIWIFVFFLVVSTTYL